MMINYSLSIGGGALANTQLLVLNIKHAALERLGHIWPSGKVTGHPEAFESAPQSSTTTNKQREQQQTGNTSPIFQTVLALAATSEA